MFDKFTDEEEIDKLSPNYVLFKATMAHNLPVMAQAISLGADKNWENPENLNRSPLHQAILAVSFRSQSIQTLADQFSSRAHS